MTESNLNTENADTVMQFLKIDHVQLAMPAGHEDRAREFYAGLLGLAEMRKPAALVRRGGVWFREGDVKVHLGIDPAFAPARKAHPAFLVRDLSTLVHRLRDAGASVIEDDLLPGYDRVYVNDPFGNRLELLQARA